MNLTLGPEKDSIIGLLKSGLFSEAKDQCSRLLLQIKYQMPPPSDRENRSSFQKVYTEFQEIERLIVQYAKAFPSIGKDCTTCINEEECRCEMQNNVQQKKIVHLSVCTPKKRVTPGRARGAARKSRGNGVSNLKKKVRMNVGITEDINIDIPNKGAKAKKEGEGKDDLSSIIPKEVLDAVDSFVSESHSNTTWDSVVGLNEIKRCFNLNVKWAPLFVNVFKGIRQPLRTFLLYGPPGTGKTLIGKALANECGRKFLVASPSIMTSKWRGDSEKLVKCLFDVASYYAPSVIFFDELDGFCMKRGSSSEHEASRRFLSEFLVRFEELNKSGEDVCIIGATNTPWDIDTAVIRRFDARFLVELPCLEARKKILENSLAELELEESFDFTRIAEKLEGYSASDIVKICRRASLKSADEYFSTLNDAHFNESEIDKDMFLPVSEDDFTYFITRTSSTVSSDMVNRYKKFDTN